MKVSPAAKRRHHDMFQETARQLNERTATPLPARVARDLLRSYPLNLTSPQALSGSLSRAHRALSLAQRGRIGTANISSLTSKINRTAYDAKHLAAMTAISPELARGRLFHQHITGIRTRKHNPHEYQYEHDIWVAETCMRLYKILTNREPPVDYVLFWLLHDSCEDHGVNQRDIRTFCGNRVARLVQGVTLPSTDDMRQMYPHLAADRLTLKNHHKTKSLNDFVIAQHILKLIDGLSACRSFAGDVKFGRIALTDDETGVKLDRFPQILSRAWMNRNLAQRRAFYDEQVRHCLTIGKDDPRNPDRIDTRILTACTDVLYEKAFGDWEKSISAARNAENAKRPATPRRQTANFPQNP